MSTSGSVESVSIAGTVFAVAADADNNMKLGGFENEMQANGDGSVRQVKTRVPWMLDGLQLSIDHDNEDLEFLQERANSPILVACSVTFASGNTYSGKGNVTGEVQGSSQSGTATITLAGSGELTKQ